MSDALLRLNRIVILSRLLYMIKFEERCKTRDRKLYHRKTIIPTCRFSSRHASFKYSNRQLDPIEQVEKISNYSNDRDIIEPDISVQ